MSSNSVTDIQAGGDFSIFVTENRNNQETELFGTGFNLFGELGIGSSKHINDMEKIDALSNFKMQDGDGKEHHLRVN
jgi:alpha-tubulin suppressor-like RCC1 family protein